VAPFAASSEIRQKRLTLDLSPELHKALKVRAVELDVPMSELLRALIEQALNEPLTLSRLAEDLRRT
jgi:predicted DNA binding CopG/RHH family protein